MKEEIGFSGEFQPIISHYYDEIKEKNGSLVHELEIDFIINVDSSLLNVHLSKEHYDYKWGTKDSEYLDDSIRYKIYNL